MVLFDSSFLMMLMQKNVSLRHHPETGSAVEFAQERVQGLVAALDKDRTRIGIPTPVLAEVLIGAGKSIGDYIKFFNQERCFKLLSFDEKAAIECAVLAGGMQLADKSPAQTAAKLKFDRQILAIALSEGIQTIYSDDNHLVKLAQRKGLAAIKIYEVPIPEAAKQGKLDV